MSEHFSNKRKQQSNELSEAFVELYKRCWGDSTRCINFQEGGEYPDGDQNKTPEQMLDLMGADRLILRETEMGAMPVFAEEKTRTFKRDKLEKSYYNSPKDSDLALTISYHDKQAQPKYRKHLEFTRGEFFIPSVLSYIVYDKNGKTPIHGYIIDYKELLTSRDELNVALEHNESDGNSTHYITQQELIENGLVKHHWENTEWSE